MEMSEMFTSPDSTTMGYNGYEERTQQRGESTEGWENEPDPAVFGAGGAVGLSAYNGHETDEQWNKVGQAKVVYRAEHPLKSQKNTVKVEREMFREWLKSMYSETRTDTDEHVRELSAEPVARIPTMPHADDVLRQANNQEVYQADNSAICQPPIQAGSKVPISLGLSYTNMPQPVLVRSIDFSPSPAKTEHANISPSNQPVYQSLLPPSPKVTVTSHHSPGQNNYPVTTQYIAREDMAVDDVQGPSTCYENVGVTVQGTQPIIQTVPAYYSQGLNQTYPPPTSSTSSSTPPDSINALTTALTNAFTTVLTRVTPAAAANPQKRDLVKVGRYDGNTGWEMYWAQFQLVAKANQWGTNESAVQLAAALDGEARRVLLDLSPMDMADPQNIARAIERQFGDPTSSTTARRQFNERVRRDGEKLGVYAAELRHLARKAFPEFNEEQQFILAKEAFISGLTPLTLRRQVRLSNPVSWEEALERAQEVEQIFGEGMEPKLESRPRQPILSQPKLSPPPQLNPRPTAAQTNRNSPDLQFQICWSCGQRGHIQYHCPAGLGTRPNANQPAPGNGLGAE